MVRTPFSANHVECTALRHRSSHAADLDLELPDMQLFPLLLPLLLFVPRSGTGQSALKPNDPRAEALIDRAVARMGGRAALDGITSIRLDMMTQWQRTTFGDHPFGDQPSYERNVEVRDYPTNNWRNTRQFLPGTLAAVDVVRDTVGGRSLDTPNGTPMVQPLNIAYVEERRELFTFAPERTLQLARQAGGLRPDRNFNRGGVNMGAGPVPRQPR